MSALVVGGQLHLEWTYSEQLHRRETIEALAQDFLQALRVLLAHCLDPEAGGFTPSDFPLVGQAYKPLDQATFDRLLAGRESLVEDIYPLTPVQQGMLFHTLSAPRSGVYIMQVSWLPRREIEVEAFKRAWQKVIRQHAILRTAFVWQGLEEPLQIVFRQATLPTRILDWQGRSPQEQEADLEALLQADRAQGFDLERPPLMRLTLVRLSETRLRVIWTHHHLAFDGWSTSLLLQEVLACYEAERRGESLVIEECRPYRDYISWLAAQEGKDAEAYWRRALAGIAAPTPLGVDQKVGKGMHPFREDTDEVPLSHAVANFQMEAAATARYQEYARQQRVTLNTLVQAAWALVLSSYSGQTDVVFGNVVAGRPPELAGAERMVGVFINTVPVRVQVWDEEEVGAWLRRLQEQQIEQRPYEYSSLVQVQGWSKIPREHPLFESLLVFENFPVQTLLAEQKDKLDVATGLALAPLEPARVIGQTNYPLTIVVAPEATIHLRVTYDRQRFERATIERLLLHIQNSLDQLVTDPRRQVATLSLLTEAERHQMLVEWNATKTDVSVDVCVHQLFEQQVEQTPEAIAVVFEDVACGFPSHVTYQQLNSQANQLAYHLRERSIGPDVLVGVCMTRSLEMLGALLAVLKAGGAYVPLDPSYPQERFTFLLEDAQIPVVLTQAHLLDRLSLASVELICVERDTIGIGASHDAQYSSNKRGNPAYPVQPDNLAYLIYTSGSTGKPKGVVNSHRAICNRLSWMQQTYQLTPRDRVLQKTPFSFDVSVWEFFLPLAAGAHLIVASPGGHQDSAYLKTLMVEQAVTMLHFVPAMLQAFLGETDLESCDSLRQVMCGGETLDASLQTRFFARFGLTEVQLHNLYGPTEATIDVTFWPCQRETLDACLPSPHRVPIGRPVANTQIYLLDRNLSPVPIGVPGDLYIGGEGLARGYYRCPDLTAERFVANPFGGITDPGTRLYRTGDVARYRADGAIEYLGRIDQQVKLRGYRIELGEIETVLGHHPAVSQCVVLMRETSPEDKQLAPTATQLVAYVAIAEKAQPFSMEEGRRYLGDLLPPFMIPTQFVFLEHLPVTPTGKVDRRALPTLVAPQLPQTETDQVPSTLLEKQLAGMWEEMLHVQHVGRNASFFALGGHSITAAIFMNKLQALLGVLLHVVTVFDAPTVSGLADYLWKRHRGAVERVFGAGAHLRIEEALGYQREREEASILSSHNELPQIPRLPRDGQQAFPLSFAQQRLWFLQQFEPTSTAYNMPAGVELAGRLNVQALDASLSGLVRRHESLRTTFQIVEGHPVQIVAPARVYSVPLVDLQGLNAGSREEQARSLVREVSERPFDLVQGPNLRVWLLRLEEQRHIVALTMHHIISDGVSSAIFVRELSTLYNAFVGGVPASLPELPIQYADFAVWQREWLRDEILAQQMSYWRMRLEGVPVLDLPTDRPRPPVQSYRGTHMSRWLAPSLRDGLKALSQQEGVTLFMLLLAAFQVLLARYCGQNDISVGTPIANRTRAEIEGLIGFFVNTLVLRTDLSGNPSFVELLRRVKEVALGAYAHQDVPFEKLVEVLHPERDMSRSPLFQVMFVLQNISEGAGIAPTQALAGVNIRPLVVDSTSSKFDLTLSLIETQQGLDCTLEYGTDLFDESRIARMLTNFQTLLEGVVRNPQAHLSDLPLFTQAEQEQVLLQWNATYVEYPEDVCLHQLFERQVMRTPEAIAVAFEEQQLTYQQLNIQANQLAYCLRGHGVGTDQLVGICMERSLEMVGALLAVLKAGAAYVPLDPSYPGERLTWMLADAQPVVVLTQTHLMTVLPTTNAQFICLDADWERISHESCLNPTNRVTPQNLAYVIYTSGSTGRPKGVMNTHRGICNTFLWYQEAYPLTQNDRLLQKTALSFDLSLEEIFWPLTTGASIVVAHPERSQESVYLLSLIAQYDVTVLEIVPSLLQVLISEETGWKGCQGLRLVMCGGETLSLELQKRFLVSHSASLHNLYGPTEAAVNATFWSCQHEMDARSVPIGRPIANAQVYLLDKNLSPVPIGATGELYIGGEGLARGYYGLSDLTAERFIANPFGGITNPGARLYRTGDLARYRTDGVIEYLGRIDQQVKLRGVRIELSEIEATLQAHPAVQEAVVVLREVGIEQTCGASPQATADPMRGNDPDSTVRQYLVAYVVVRIGESFTASSLRTYLRERLPSPMVPTFIVFLEALPLTPNGKVDRMALPVVDRAQLHQDETQISSPSGAGLQTVLHELLGQIWKDVLTLPQVGIHDNFFELGGHSLLATQVVARMRRVLDVDVPLRSLFEAPTIAQLSRRLEGVMHAAGSAVACGLVPQVCPAPMAMERSGELPLSFAQERLWFLDQWAPGSAWYNVPMALRLSGLLQVRALEGSLAVVVQRHEVLRTTFSSRQGRPVQVIASSGTGPRVGVPVIDLRGLTSSQGDQQVRKLARAEAQRPFDLAYGPLVRVHLLQLATEQEHVLLLTLHHIVTDGWSMDILASEITALYQDQVNGEPIDLPVLPLQYADYALWQRQWLQGEVLDLQIAYWKQQLAGAPTQLKLPTDRPRSMVPSNDGASLGISISTELTDKLEALSQREGVTLFMLLLTAFQVLLYHHTGQEDMVVGTDVANRTWTEVEELIGFFVNQLVLRTNLSGNPTFLEVLQQVKQVTLGAYTHQDLPFEKLVEVLNPERSVQYAPLFQAKITFDQSARTPRGDSAGMLSEIYSGGPLGFHISPLQLEVVHTKLDAELHLVQLETSITGKFIYNTNLFNTSTIKRLATHFEVLLEHVVKHPDTGISAIELLAPAEKEQRHMEKNKRLAASLNTWKQVKPKPVSLRQENLLTITQFQPDQPLPLIIQPNSQGLNLVEWARHNVSFVETGLLKHGGILFRGFDVRSPLEFEHFAAAICPHLFHENGEHPREAVSSNIYTPVFYPPEKKLLWHSENSFNATWPTKIWFYCSKPAEQGGETPIVDNRRVFQQIAVSIRERFMQKNIMYVRNYRDGLGLSWQTVFSTTNKAEVEAACRKAGIEFEWKDGDCLRTRQVRPAVLKHPKTGEWVWWNQATHWHIACLEQSIRDSLFALFREEDLPRSCYYGDGQPIEDTVMEAICQAYQQAEVSFPWQPGDILLLDNMLTAHARNAYQGERKIYVAMGDMLSL